MNNKNLFNCLWVALPAVLLFATAEAHAGKTSRVSVSSAGVQGNNSSFPSAISADGRYLAFSSTADNLVAADLNGGAQDAFVRDRVTGMTSLVSVDSAGTQGNNTSFPPRALSGDGRYVAFASFADNLVADDTDGTLDAFVHDRVTGQTTRVSVSSSGTPGNDSSTPLSISADGRYVLLASLADNLVVGDTNGTYDAFVHDRLTHKTTRVSVSSSGAQGNNFSSPSAISSDGRFVAFTSYADNLVSKDTNGGADAFVHDRLTGQTTRVSINSLGKQGIGGSWAGAISANGRYVAFGSDAANLSVGGTNGVYDAYVHDRVTGQTTRVSVNSSSVPGNDYSEEPSAISADGRYVAFKSWADNLVAGDTNGVADAFIHDRMIGLTSRVSVGSAGVQGNYESYPTAISADGRYVALYSGADNLVAKDTNETYDAFVRDRLLDSRYSADLQVTVAAKTVSVKKGQTASYLLTVKNKGPDSAGNVALTHVVINGTMADIRPSQGRCSKAAITVCRLGILTSGASAKIVVNIKAHTSPLTQQVSVSAAPKDNAPRNNAIKFSTLVTP